MMLGSSIGALRGAAVPVLASSGRFFEEKIKSTDSDRASAFCKEFHKMGGVSIISGTR